MKRFLTAAAVCVLLPAVAGPVRNGSFESFGGNGVPENWTFTRSNDAPVTVFSSAPGADGEKCLRVVSRMERKIPHTFGLLSQTVKLKPDTDYVFVFSARGRNVGHVGWAFGKGWLIRHPVTGVTEEWREFRVPLRIPADRMEGRESCGVRLIVEGGCGELDIDKVDIVPAEKTLVANGSFNGKAGESPAGWSFRVSGGAKVKMAADGAGALHIVNETPRKPHTFGALAQTVKLSPEVDYLLRLRARGSGQGVTVAVGSKWAHRLSVQPLDGVWRVYELRFRLASDEVGRDGSTPLVIISEDRTDGAWLDDLSVTPLEQWSLPQASWQRHGITLAGAFSGEFAELNGIPAGMHTMRIPADADHTQGTAAEKTGFAAKTALAFDSDGLIFLAAVTDRTSRPGSGEAMWKEDCVQLRIDRGARRLHAPAETDLELGFSVGADGRVRNWCWDAGSDPYGGELPEELVQAHGVRTPAGYFVAARLSWKLLGGLRQSGKFGFTVAVNDSAGKGERTVHFLTPGLHDAKYSDRYVQALLDTGEPVCWAAFPADSSAGLQRGSLLCSNLAGDVRIAVELTGTDGKKSSRELGMVPEARKGELVFFPAVLPLDGLARGSYTAEFKINGVPVAKYAGSRIDLYEQQCEAVAAFCAETERLRREFSRYYGESAWSEYVSVPLRVLERWLPRLRRRLELARNDGEKEYYARQAAMVHRELEESLAALAEQLSFLKGGGSLPVAWKFKSGPVVLEKGWPVADAVSENGRRERRPVIFSGYGHFNDIDRDIALFPKIGGNVVQVEIGPRHLFPAAGTVSAAVEERLLPLLEKAYRSDVKIALLISPHYCPQWLLDQCPEMAASSGFLKYEVTHPEAQKMMRRYIAALFEKLRQSPYLGALHSICLSNEPVYSNCHPDNPWSAARFREYIERKHGSPAGFNRTAGRNFGSYDEMLKAVRDNDPASLYEFYTFSRETFAGWHRMLAELVKKELPDVPVHAKIMVFSSPFEYVTGVDPELMSDFSDYNGNDNYFYRRGRYAADWNVTAMTHEMQISAKSVSVANTENHIIPDRETRPVPNDHIYTANFQQFITGASTLCTWVWADIDYDFIRKNPANDFGGNIFLRPGNVIAHALAGLDGVRLAPEIRKFMDYEPEVAILYSPTATILSPGSYRGEVDRLYTALCFTGYRVRFLSERQLARGEFGKVRLLYVAGAPNVSRAARDGMRKFTEAGGRIAVAGNSLTQDEYGQDIPAGFRTEPTAPFTPEALTAQILRSVKALPAAVKVDHEKGNDGVFFRMVPDGTGSWLVNVVNYNFEPRRLRFEGNGTFRDLIREREFEPQLTLAPLKPQLLRFTPRQ